MMRACRLGIVVVLTAGLVVSTGITGGAETAQKAPRGFHTVKVKKAGFSIAVPDEWSVVDPTRKDADQILAPLREAPLYLDEIPPAADFAAEKVVLFVFDDRDAIDVREARSPDPLAEKSECAECFLVTVKVGFDPGQTEPLTVSDVASITAQYAAPGSWGVVNFMLEVYPGTVEADVSETKIAGVEAVKAEFDHISGIGYSGVEFNQHMIQYNLTGKRGGYYFQFAASGGVGSRCPCAPATGDLDALADFDTMADSIRLLKGHR